MLWCLGINKPDCWLQIAEKSPDFMGSSVTFYFFFFLNFN